MDQACCLMPSEVRQIVMTLSIASITAAGCRTVCTFTLSQNDGGSDPFIAALFFGSFTVVAQFVLLNVVIAVLMAQVHLQISSCKACAYHLVDLQLEEANEADAAGEEEAAAAEEHKSDSDSSDESE